MSWWHALEAGQIPLQLRFVALSIFCSVLPDVDVVGFAFDIPYGHAFGHRGFFHSLFFALMLALFVVQVCFPHRKVFSAPWWLLFGYFFLLTASHGLLDTLTRGGFGIALLAPFNHTRYLAPVSLFEAAPLHFTGLFTAWGIRCIRAEFFIIWVPALAVIAWTRWQLAVKRQASEKSGPLST